MLRLPFQLLCSYDYNKRNNQDNDVTIFTVSKDGTCSGESVKNVERRKGFWWSKECQNSSEMSVTCIRKKGVGDNNSGYVGILEFLWIKKKKYQ